MGRCVESNIRQVVAAVLAAGIGVARRVPRISFHAGGAGGFWGPHGDTECVPAVWSAYQSDDGNGERKLPMARSNDLIFDSDDEAAEWFGARRRAAAEHRASEGSLVCAPGYGDCGSDWSAICATDNPSDCWFCPPRFAFYSSFSIVGKSACRFKPCAPSIDLRDDRAQPWEFHWTYNTLWAPFGVIYNTSDPLTGQTCLVQVDVYTE